MTKAETHATETNGRLTEFSATSYLAEAPNECLPQARRAEAQDSCTLLLMSEHSDELLSDRSRLTEEKLSSAPKLRDARTEATQARDSGRATAPLRTMRDNSRGTSSRMETCPRTNNERFRGVATVLCLKITIGPKKAIFRKRRWWLLKLTITSDTAIAATLEQHFTPPCKLTPVRVFMRSCRKSHVRSLIHSGF